MDKIIGDFIFDKNTKSKDKLNNVSENLYKMKHYSLLLHIFYFCVEKNIPYGGCEKFFINVGKSFYHVGEYSKCYEVLDSITTYTNCIDFYLSLKKYMDRSWAHTHASSGSPYPVTYSRSLSGFFTICIVHKEYNEKSHKKLSLTLSSVMNSIQDISLVDEIIVVYRKTEMMNIDRRKEIGELNQLYPFLTFDIVDNTNSVTQKISEIKTQYTFLMESGWIFTKVYPYLSIFLQNPSTTLMINEEWLTDILYTPQNTLQYNRSEVGYTRTCVTPKMEVGCVSSVGPINIYFYYYTTQTGVCEISIKCIQPCIYKTSNYPKNVLSTSIRFLVGNMSFHYSPFV